MRILKEWIANCNISKSGILLILLVVTLLPFLILSFYNHPSPGDDYIDADLVLQRGFWGAQKYWYLNLTGRWFAVMMISLTPLVFHAYSACKFNAIIFLLLLVIATYWLSGKLFKNLNTSVRIGITSLFIFTFIIRLPGVGDGIFWQSIEYITFSAEIMTLFLFGSIISYNFSINKKWYFIISCLLLIAIISSYEINMIYIDFAILIISFTNIVKKRELFFSLSLLAVCIVFSLIDIMAPGNNNRAMNFFPHGHQLLFSIKESIFTSKTYLIHWLPFMFFIGLLLFDLLSKRNISNEDTDAIFVIPPGLSLTACLLIPIIGFFVLFWAEGQYPPSRSINVIFFYFVIGMLYFSFSFIIYIKKRFPDFTFPSYIKLAIYCMLVFILIFRPNNISVAYTDIISGAASEYNKQLLDRNEYLKNFKGDSCIVTHIKNIPKSFVFYELPPDSLCEKPNTDDDNIRTVSQYLYRVRTSFNHYYHKKYIGIK